MVLDGRNNKSFFDKELSEHEAVLRATRNTLAEPFMELCDVAEKTLKKKPLPVFAQKSIHYEKPIISTAPEIIERKFRLKEFQKDALATQNKKVGKKKRNKTLKKKRYTLGKSGNTIGILIKSKATRKKIKKEHGNLKKKKIKDIKLYLKKHGLMKVGSNAPEELCRGIYETAMLSGDIYNKNSNILLHNYINDK